MRAILIDPKARTVTDIEVRPGIEPIYEALQCRTFDVVALDDTNGVYIDDDGLYVEGQHFFMFGDFHQPLGGRGLILGMEPETGESVSTELALAEIESKIKWIDDSIKVAGFQNYGGEIDHPVFGKTFVIGSHAVFEENLADHIHDTVIDDMIDEKERNK